MYIFSCKNELSELIDIGNKDIEDKSNLLLQDQLNKCNTIIEVLQQENMQQKAEVIFYSYNLCIINMIIM